jgi:tRNA1(Val) A37 N6-methylase TrmN6
MLNEHLEPLSKAVSVFVSDEYHFNTDTIFLAHFSLPRRGERCADLGTGCGAIPLLWMTRTRPESVCALELQPRACELARRSVLRGGFGGVITVREMDVREVPEAAKRDPLLHHLDLVACNPPYKAAGAGGASPRAFRRIARSEAECTLADIARAGAAALRFGGRFCLCQRPERLCEVLLQLKAHGLEPKRLRFIQQRPGAAPGLFLVQARRGGRPGGLAVEPPLLIEDGCGNFSREMTEIYGEYREGCACPEN